MVSNWEPAHSLAEDAISGAEIAPHLLALAVTCLPLCLGLLGEEIGPPWLALLWYSLSPFFCEQAGSGLRLELFLGKFSLSLFPLFLFFSLSAYLTVWDAISH